MGPRSGIWRITSNQNDIYVSEGGLRNQKISFHESKICRRAFHETQIPVTLENRLTHRWKRQETPPSGTGHARLLMKLSIPTDFLSTALEAPKKPVKWIPAASIGETRLLCLLLTNDTENQLRTQLNSFYEIVAYQRLPNNEAATVITCAVSSNDKEFAVPSSHHQNKHMLISKRDPNKTGRPIRFILSDNPKDGDCLQAWEYGAYYTDGAIPPGIGRFTRSTVIATQDTPVWSQAK